MAEGEEHIELKFRIYDGTDIGHRTYASSTTVATLKQRLVADWPPGYPFIFCALLSGADFIVYAVIIEIWMSVRTLVGLSMVVCHL